jgi:hypothetical protein
VDRAIPARTRTISASGRRARVLQALLSMLLCCGCLLDGGFGLPPVFGQTYSEAVNREYPLKALFLFNFGSYVEWPTGVFKADNDPFVIGVLGTSAMDGTLRELARTKAVDGRRLEWKRFANAADVTHCQILFIARSVSTRECRKVIDSLRSKPTLVVGESRNFCTDGGGMNFYEEANKIRFEVNLKATKEQGLKISSKLLAMAKIVQTAPDP